MSETFDLFDSTKEFTPEELSDKWRNIFLEEYKKGPGEFRAFKQKVYNEILNGNDSSLKARLLMGSEIQRGVCLLSDTELKDCMKAIADDKGFYDELKKMPAKNLANFIFFVHHNHSNVADDPNVMAVNSNIINKVLMDKDCSNDDMHYIVNREIEYKNKLKQPLSFEFCDKLKNYDFEEKIQAKLNSRIVEEQEKRRNSLMELDAKKYDMPTIQALVTEAYLDDKAKTKLQEVAVTYVNRNKHLTSERFVNDVFGTGFVTSICGDWFREIVSSLFIENGA